MKVLACPKEDLGQRAGVHYELLSDTNWRPVTVLFNLPGDKVCYGEPQMELGLAIHLTLLSTKMEPFLSTDTTVT